MRNEDSFCESDYYDLKDGFSKISIGVTIGGSHVSMTALLDCVENLDLSLSLLSKFIFEYLVNLICLYSILSKYKIMLIFFRLYFSINYKGIIN